MSDDPTKPGAIPWPAGDDVAMAPPAGGPDTPRDQLIHPVVATYALVGVIATTWSSLEHAIDNALCIMSGLDKKTGTCLTSQIQSVRAKLIALEALAHLRGANEQSIKAIRRFQNESEAPSRKRNMVVHNPIMNIPGKPADGSNMVLARVSGDRRSIAEYQPITAEEMRLIQNEIAALLPKFAVIMNDHILPLRPSSPGTPPAPPVPIQADRPPVTRKPSTRQRRRRSSPA